ncbi:hypothetical protein [Pseudobacteriovorax antillogorgiicola]|uniref:Uncharacterized protein n=1 Tax=Pseudobacteriovorax antillogorgiicola TaxID=1513793 RepID=A0A1Y6BPZ8_9BACT|nr:hypothetical protein [Pseudobacteriovorax antillogorgiicola]TCS53694.1 hypothetical protein EDD56_1073 [Pseudobacteriovorax antillogorgiicola]SMF23126.1 hypothetical protein SAMN06296036_107269 [Pseudobacteriovorax antillogorgiicola]
MLEKIHVIKFNNLQVDCVFYPNSHLHAHLIGEVKKSVPIGQIPSLISEEKTKHILDEFGLGHYGVSTYLKIDKENAGSTTVYHHCDQEGGPWAMVKNGKLVLTGMDLIDEYEMRNLSISEVDTQYLDLLSNQPNYSKLFNEADDPNYPQYPNGNYKEIRIKVEAAGKKLKALLNNHFSDDFKIEAYPSIQDASYGVELTIPACLRTSNSIIKLYLSNFGNFAAVLEEDGAISPSNLCTIASFCEKVGLRFVPSIYLFDKYTGKCKGVDGFKDWASRFFSYI